MINNLLLAAALASRDIRHRFAAGMSYSTSSVARRTNSLGHYPDIVRTTFERLRSDKREFLVLDGGTGEELFRRGVPDDRKIWSATAIVKKEYHPILGDVHASFLRSGSDAVTTNSYGIVPGVGFSEAEIAEHVAVAGRIARESARRTEAAEDDAAERGGGCETAGGDSPPPPRGAAMVLGSLGPLVESYRPDLVMDREDGAKAYSIAAEALSPHVDCFLAETMSSVEESAQAVEGVGKLDDVAKRPMMVSYTLGSDGALRSGEAVKDSIRRIVGFAKERGVRFLGVLFNCAEPEAITTAFLKIKYDKGLQTFLDENGIILGAYANRLTPVPPNWTMAESEEAQPMRDDLSPRTYFDKFVSIWVNDLGVQMVGGCCGITPEHISYIRSRLPRP